jgi:riboflavin synthase
MFTGLVEAMMQVRAVQRRAAAMRLRLAIPHTLAARDAGDTPSWVRDPWKLGESVNVAGVCLTVARVLDDGFEADVSAETLRVTTLGDLAVGRQVNIERALALGERLGGHLVLGHVDAVGRVRHLEAVGAATLLAVQGPRELMRFFAPKGSVTVDGVSLTINTVDQAAGFSVMLVPHTLAVTTLGALAAGDRLNLEIDVLARYVGRQLEVCGVVNASDATGDGELMSALRKGGFVEGA